MSRYIDADALESELFRDGIAGIFLNYPRRTKFTIGEIRGMLKNERIAPTADVVEVVRCKDCQHWKNTSYDTVTEDHWGECRKPLGDYRYCETAENDYCSYGERREECSSQ